MYNPPSIHKITHYAILRDDTKIPLTEEQFEKVEFNKVNEKSTFLQKISDLNTWKVIYNWEIWAIKGFQEIKKQDNSNIRYICDFGLKHPINEECWCKNKYWIFWVQFRYKAHQMFPNKFYMQDLSEEQRLQVLKTF